MTIEYKNEVANRVELENGELLDVVSGDPKFGDGVVSRLNEQDESHEWEEVEKRSCTIQKIYEYPIIGPGNERKIGHGFILKPDTLKNNESKDFTISAPIDEMDISQFKEGQKVWHITYKQERPATDKEKQYYKMMYGEDIETTTDWKHVTKLKEQDESHEWTEVERRTCIIKKIYEYPITGPGNEREIGHGFILKPVTLKNNESKDFKISHAIDEEDISQFKEGQKVGYITYKCERPATDKEKQYYKMMYGEDIEIRTDWKHVTKPIESEK